jgi:hypothetical protein
VEGDNRPSSERNKLITRTGERERERVSKNEQKGKTERATEREK